MGQTARNAAIHVNGYDLTTYFAEEESTFDSGLEDTTAFGPSVVAKSFTATIAEASLMFRGWWTSGAAAVWRVLRDAIATTTKSVVSIWHIGDAVGNSGLAMQSDLSSLKVPMAVSGALKIEVEFKSSVGEEDVVSLHPFLTQETGAGNGTTVDNTAATTAGGSAYLQVSDVGTTMTVTIRHSTDNFVGDDTLLGTFAAVTVDRTVERIVLSGTIKRYVRIAWTQTGNTTFGVALHRN